MAEDWSIHIVRSGNAWLEQLQVTPETRRRYDRILGHFYRQFEHMPTDAQQVIGWVGGLKFAQPHQKGPKRSPKVRTKHRYYRVLKMYYAWVKENYDHPGTALLPDLTYQSFRAKKWRKAHGATERTAT